MSVYYPQGGLILDVFWENFENNINASNLPRSEFRVQALNLSVDINSYYEADTFQATLDYKTFPFDPRSVRAILVKVFIKNVEQLDDGVSLKKIVPSEQDAVFIGHVDDLNVSYDGGDRVVTMEGRDYTGIFLDNLRQKKTPIDYTKPLFELLQDLLNEREATRRIKLDNQTSEIAIAAPASFDSDKGELGGLRNPKRNESYWDIIQSIVRKIGLIAYIYKDTLVVTRPQTLYRRQRRVQMIYGNNISSLSYGRKLGRQKAQNILLVSYTLKDKKRVTAFIPQDSKDPEIISRYGDGKGKGAPVYREQLDTNGEPLGTPVLAETISFNISGVDSQEQLIIRGDQIFHQISRQHLEGNLTTNEMVFVRTTRRKVEPLPVDFTAINVGSAVEVVLRQNDLEGIGSLSSFNEKKNYLISKNYPAQIAEEFAKSLTKVDYTFYVKAVRYSLDSDGGFSMDVDFINFIEVENKALAPKSKKTTQFDGGNLLPNPNAQPDGTSFGDILVPVNPPWARGREIS